MMCGAPLAAAQPFVVETGKTYPLRLNGSAASVVVGNPAVADITVFDDRLVFVTGKSYGATNIMVFDATGSVLYANDVKVVRGSQSTLRVVRAGNAETFDCTPDCRAVLNPGDSPGFFQNVLQQTQQLAQAANAID
jgi:hypothetical protein